MIQKLLVPLRNSELSTSQKQSETIWLHNSKFRNQRLTVQQHSATMFPKLNILISEAMIAPFRRVLVSVPIHFKYPPLPHAPQDAIVWPSPSKSSCHGSESFKKPFPPVKQGAKDCYVNLPWKQTSRSTTDRRPFHPFSGLIDVLQSPLKGESA